MRRIAAVAVGVASALSAATWVVEARAERFAPIGPELLADPGFARGLDAWTVYERGGAKVIASADGVTLDVSGCPHDPDLRACQASIEQVIPYSGVDPVEVSAELTRSTFRDGVAYVLVADRDARGLALSFDWEIGKDHQLFPPSPWAPYHAVQHPHPGTAAVAVRLVRMGVDGNLAARGVSLRPVREKGLFRALTAALQVAWVAFFAWIAVLTWRIAPRPRLHAATLALAVVIIAALVAPMPDIAVTPSEIAAARPDAPVAGPASAPSTSVAPIPRSPPAWLRVGRGLRAAFPSDERDHFALFAALGALAAIAWRGTPTWVVGATVVGFAALTEALQWFTAHRTAGLDDLATDSVGIGVGMVGAIAVGALQSWLASGGPAAGSRDDGAGPSRG